MKQRRSNYTARKSAVVAATAVFSVFAPFACFADVCRADTNSDGYYYSDSVNTGHDNGFSKKNKIKSSDPHYGWNLGQFCVNGFTGTTEDSNGNMVFLKNVGDTVTLSFELFEDIDRLNDDGDLSISKDKNGYDEYFETDKTNCGRGMLIVRKTDSQNGKSEPLIYTDYLSGIETDAVTEIALFEEGDYEVALDYEIKEERHVVGFVPWFPKYRDYRIFFRFSVRNGNCMAYPIELNTNRELGNNSVTEEGFSIDFVNSRYLDICIQYESVSVSEEGIVTDVRYNRTAREGEVYSEEGIYTITAKNKYTSQTTVKVIRVGSGGIVSDEKESFSKTGLFNMDGFRGIFVTRTANQTNNSSSVGIALPICMILVISLSTIVFFKLRKKRH